MRLHRENCLFFFSILLIFGTQSLRAQDKITLPVFIAEANIPAPESENPAPSFQTTIVVDKPHEIVRARQSGKAVSETSLRSAAKTENPESSLRTAFRTAAAGNEHADFSGSTIKDLKKVPFRMPRPPATPNTKKISEEQSPNIPATGFNWRGALTQSFMFLGVQHGFALILQEKTRRSLKGKFWGDYVDSVKALRGWDDGGRFFTNYIAHPLQGSFTGFIYVQNSPQARRAQFGASRDYWSSRMKAMLWTTVWSTQFEIGPISQASIGNVGLGGKQTWEDIVVTPTLGTVMLIAEDAVDRYIIKSIERRWDNFYVKIFSRMLLNPTRIFANMLRFKAPWYRDRPTAK